MDKKNVIVSAVVALAVTLALVWGFPPAAKIVERVERAGALSSPDIQSPWFRVGGVQQDKNKHDLATATTTPCYFGPVVATSTLLRTNLRIDVATSTATTWTVAKARTQYATTTSLFTGISLGSGTFGTMSYMATTTGIDTKDVLSPGDYVVWSVAGTTIADATKLTGSCEIEVGTIY